MSKRPIHFENYSSYVKKRSKKIFNKKLTPLHGEGPIEIVSADRTEPHFTNQPKTQSCKNNTAGTAAEDDQRVRFNHDVNGNYGK